MMKLAMENNLSETAYIVKEEQIRNMQPDQAMLMKIEGRLQNATTKGEDADCVSRSFAPKVAVPEDPVCGSAHWWLYLR